MPQRVSIYLHDILREFVKTDDEIFIDLEPLKEAISNGIVIKTYPLFYVLQDSCMSDTYDQQLMKNFKGVYSFIAFAHIGLIYCISYSIVSHIYTTVSYTISINTYIYPSGNL